MRAAIHHFTPFWPVGGVDVVVKVGVVVVVGVGGGVVVVVVAEVVVEVVVNLAPCH